MKQISRSISIRGINTMSMSMKIAVPGSMSLISSLFAAVALHSPRKHKHKRSRSMPSRLQGCPISTYLQDQLAGEVQRLEQQAGCSSSSSCFGADWLGQALEVVVNAYSNLLDTDIEGIGCKWMNQHLDDMVHLLEVCNLLRDTLSEIRNQQMCVQVAIRGLGVNPNAYALERARTSLSYWVRKSKDTQSKLEKCISILKQMADKLNLEEKIGAGGEASTMAINHSHTKAITILLCSALVTALCFKTPRMRMPALPLPGKFTSLQDKLKEAFEMRKRSSSSSSRFLQELEVADIALRNLNNLLDSNCKLGLHLQLSPTRIALHDLEKTLPLFEQRINQLFKVLISARVALLNTISLV